MKVYVVLDLEMCEVLLKTNKYPYRNEIIQIGAVKMDESYKIVDKY